MLIQASSMVCLSNSACWMHLGVGETSALFKLQAMTGTMMQHYIMHLRLLVRNTNNNINMIAIDASIKALLHRPVVLFDSVLSC